jgi:hypothetical protein
MKITFMHTKDGVILKYNEEYCGMFDSEKDAWRYLILNYFNSLFEIERKSE